MHQVQSFIDRYVLSPAPGVPPTSLQLTPPLASGMRHALNSDAVGLCYSGAISIAEGVRGIEKGLFTWSIVKLYYSTFYLARALLAFKDVAIFYSKQTPYRWRARPGEVAVKLRGNTHGVVLEQFERSAIHPALVGQQIGNSAPFEWLREQRETANYKNPRFEEPGTPPALKKIATLGVRRVIEAYISDNSFLYAFDADHAILSLPIEFLKLALTELSTQGLGKSLPLSDREYIATLCLDSRGPIPSMRRLLLN